MMNLLSLRVVRQNFLIIIQFIYLNPSVKNNVKTMKYEDVIELIQGISKLNNLKSLDLFLDMYCSY